MFSLLRIALTKAATDAGLAGIAFLPEANPQHHVEYERDPNGGSVPKIPFALTATSEESPLSVTIRGTVARSLPQPMNAAFYFFSPLELILTGTGEPTKRTNWQPMANDFDDEDDDSVVARVQPHYSVDGRYLRMKLRVLNRTQT